jgi:hypothetical protein
MPASHVSVSCPACDQAFLTLHNGLGAMQACPHCAYTTQLSAFMGAGAIAAAAAPQMPKQQRRFAPTLPAALRPADQGVGTGLPVPVPVSLGGRPEMLERVALADEEEEEEPEVGWSSLKPSRVPGAFALGPTGDEPLQSKAYELAQPRGFPWAWVLVGLTLAGCVTGLLLLPSILEGQRRTLSSEGAESAAVGQQGLPEPLQTIAVAKPAYPMPAECALGLEQSKTLLHELLVALSGAQSLEDKLRCVAKPLEKRKAMEQFFALPQNDLRVSAFRVLPVRAKLLPGRYDTFLFEARTNALGRGTSILRLTGPDASNLKIDWDLLEDSHTGALTEFMKDKSARPRWVSVGLKRNFGFEEPAEVRDMCHMYDVQGQGDGSDRVLALCPKDSAFGRALEQAVSWNDLYLVRVLVGWSPIEGSQRLTLLDAMQMPGL